MPSMEVAYKILSIDKGKFEEPWEHLGNRNCGLHSNLVTSTDSLQGNQTQCQNIVSIGSQ